MHLSLVDEVALVTGGASGIGRGTALALAAEGAHVMVCDRDVGGGMTTVAEIAARGGSADFVVCDVADEESVRRSVATTERRFGRLTCAVNAAGIFGDPAKAAPVAQLDTPEFDRIVAVNLRGVFLAMKYELLAMTLASRGSIVNLASTAGLIGSINCAGYVASKHGIVGLTRAAAIEYARMGIRVNAVCPGLVDTPMSRDSVGPEHRGSVIERLPMGRMAEVSEVVAAVVMLCSSRSSFITGAALPIDGGLVAQ